MIFINDQKIYAKVWKIQQEQEKLMKLQISTSEKGEAEGEYKRSGWFATVIGHAKNSLKDVQEGNTIIIKRAKLTNEYVKEKQQSYFNFVILEAEIQGTPSQEKPKEKPKSEEPKKDDPF